SSSSCSAGSDPFGESLRLSLRSPLSVSHRSTGRTASRPLTKEEGDAVRAGWSRKEEERKGSASVGESNLRQMVIADSALRSKATRDQALDLAFLVDCTNSMGAATPWPS